MRRVMALWRVFNCWQYRQWKGFPVFEDINRYKTDEYAQLLLMDLYRSLQLLNKSALSTVFTFLETEKLKDCH